MLEMLQFLVIIYLWVAAGFFSFYLVILLLTKLFNEQSKIAYHMKIFFLYYTFTMVSILILPVMLVRPRNVDNCR